MCWEEASRRAKKPARQHFSEAEYLQIRRHEAYFIDEQGFCVLQACPLGDNVKYVCLYSVIFVGGLRFIIDTEVQNVRRRARLLLQFYYLHK